IHAVTPASAGIGMRSTTPEPSHKIPTRNSACIRFETRVVPPHRTTARLRAEQPAQDVGRPISAQFRIRVGGLHALVTPSKMLHHARRDENIYGRDKC